MDQNKRLFCGIPAMPYGHLSWIVPLITLFAFVFFMIPSFACSLTVEKRPGNVEIWYGYWKKESTEFVTALGAEEDSNVCVRWGKGASRNIFDAPWKFGKAVGVMGFFTTIIAVAGNVYMFFERMSLVFFFPWIGLHILNSFFNFMLLIGIKSLLCTSRECKLARAGYVAIVGGIFWLVVAILLVLVRNAERQLQDEDRPVGDQYDDEPDLEQIEDDPEKETPLALPAPEVYLALPPSETVVTTEQTSKKPKMKSSTSTSGRNDGTFSPKKSPGASSNAEKSPRKGNPSDESSTSPRRDPIESSKSKGKKKKKPTSETTVKK